MKEPGPIIVAQLFPEVLDELVGLLSSLLALKALDMVSVIA
jgi:hypothetical protein